MADHPDTLVVIPCLNEAAHIGALLAQLLDDPGCRTAQIIVADGGSTDATRQIAADWAARDLRVRLFDNVGKIQSSGVNGAVRMFGAGKVFLVRIDAHCGYPKDFVQKIVATFRRTKTQSVVVPMRTEGGVCFQRAVAAAQNSRLGTGGSAHRVGAASGYIDHGHHAAWDLAAFAAAGGYDETFSHNEDAEFDLRLTRSGGLIWLAGEAPITYFPRASPGPLLRQYMAYGRGRARTLRRHRVRLKPRQLLPLLVAPAILLAPAAALWAPLILPFAAWAAASLLYGVVLAIRNRDNCVLASGAAAMIMHLGWSIGFWREQLFGRAPGAFAGQRLI